MHQHVQRLVRKVITESTVLKHVQVTVSISPASQLMEYAIYASLATKGKHHAKIKLGVLTAPYLVAFIVSMDFVTPRRELVPLAAKTVINFLTVYKFASKANMVKTAALNVQIIAQLTNVMLWMVHASAVCLVYKGFSVKNHVTGIISDSTAANCVTINVWLEHVNLIQVNVTLVSQVTMEITAT